MNNMAALDIGVLIAYIESAWKTEMQRRFYVIVR